MLQINFKDRIGQVIMCLISNIFMKFQVTQQMMKKITKHFKHNTNYVQEQKFLEEIISKFKTCKELKEF